jgi:hypothetical protein
LGATRTDIDADMGMIDSFAASTPVPRWRVVELAAGVGVRLVGFGREAFAFADRPE